MNSDKTRFAGAWLFCLAVLVTLDASAGPLGVTQTDPTAGATGVEPNADVRAVFDRDLRVKTVTGDTFTLTRDGKRIKGNVGVANNNVAVLVPIQPLAPLTEYTARLDGMTDIDGRGLQQPVTWRFTTRDGLWGTAELIEHDDAGGAAGPQIAVDRNGNAIAVWYQWDGAHSNIVANRFIPGTGWGSPQVIETEAGEAYLPRIAMDPNGNAIAVWFQDHSSTIGTYSIWANCFTPAGGWGSAQLIESNPGSASYPQVAINASGNAVAVWHQWDGTRYHVWANSLTSAGWANAQLIDANLAAEASNPKVAIDRNGNAIAVWHQNDGAYFNVWANRFTPTAGWGSAGTIESNPEHALYPQIAVAGTGEAVAVWQQSDGARYRVWANRLAPAAAWGTAQVIDPNVGQGAASPQVAIDANGNAVAAWQQYDGVRYNIEANRLTPGAGWGNAQLIETNAGNTSAPQVTIDSDGKGIAVWSQWDSAGTKVWANRFTPANGWGNAQSIGANGYWPQVAINSHGRAVAVWSAPDAAQYSIWANRFE